MNNAVTFSIDILLTPAFVRYVLGMVLLRLNRLIDLL